MKLLVSAENEHSFRMALEAGYDVLRSVRHALEEFKFMGGQNPAHGQEGSNWSGHGGHFMPPPHPYPHSHLYPPHPHPQMNLNFHHPRPFEFRGRGMLRPPPRFRGPPRGAPPSSQQQGPPAKQ